MKINLSKTLEESLERLLREERARRWQEENREAIEALQPLRRRVRGLQ